jgi:hypothetical protein
MLEDVLQPKRLYWLAHVEMLCPDPSHRQTLADTLSAWVCSNLARSRQYLSEVVRVYCWVTSKLGSSDPFTTPVFKFSPTVLQSNSTPALDDTTVDRLVTEISASAGNTNNAQRLLVHHLQTQMVASLPSDTCHAHTEGDGMESDRLTVLVRNYSAECTFKTNGDFLIHAFLIVLKLPPWASSMLCLNQMPYPLMKQTYPDTVNAEVRPLLDATMDERMDAVAWASPSFVAEDYIVVVALLLEIMASTAVTLLVNGTLLHNLDSGVPHPFIVRRDDTTIATGVRHASVFYYHPDSLTALERVVAWLRFAHDHGDTPTRHICEVVMHDVPRQGDNPLCKFSS